MKSEFLKDLESAMKVVLDKNFVGENQENIGLLLVSVDLCDKSGANIFVATKGYGHVMSETLLAAMDSHQDLADVVIDASTQYAYERVSKRPDPTIQN